MTPCSVGQILVPCLKNVRDLALVSTLAYKHTLRPSTDKASTVVIDLINALSPSARQSILDEINKSNK
ncbi:hypothetical protein ACK36U_20015 [Aeromonas veronii]